MLDSGQIKMQRAAGKAAVGMSMRGGRVCLDDLHQSGCAKVFLPQIHQPVPEVVFLNTAGGITGGDRLNYTLNVGAGAQVTGTTQTAERAYKSCGGTGEISVNLSVADGARLDWLPQETILFDESNVSRRSEVQLHGSASVLMVETVILGRMAMGEALNDLSFFDARHVLRDGVPVFIEPLKITGETLRARSGAAMFGEATALSTIAFVAQGAEDVAATLRDLDNDPAVSVAVSGWNGKTVLRLMAKDGWPLRLAVARIVTQLRGAPMPRVWQM
ncbi:MAG: urease accessory protein UreD [Pseudoruegeria sp.]